MRHAVIALCMLLGSVTPAMSQVSVGIAVPGLSIGITSYPDLVRVRGYPVYYAPRVRSNLFFYDGMYWVYQGDSWYASSWYRCSLSSSSCSCTAQRSVSWTNPAAAAAWAAGALLVWRPTEAMTARS